MPSTNSTAHTAGPWSYSWETESRDWAIVTDPAGSIIANVNTETGPDAQSAPATRKMPAEANACLIAAAPELLAALEKLMACCEEHPAFTKTSNTITFGRMNAARAAIAAAKGGA